MGIRENTVLRRLSRVEFARFLPDVGQIELAPGQVLDPREDAGDYLYAVSQGLLGVVAVQGDHECVLDTLEAGDLFAEERLVEAKPEYFVRSITASVVCRMPASSVRSMMDKDPGLVVEMMRRVTERLALRERELVQLRTVFAPYGPLEWQQPFAECAPAGDSSLTIAPPMMEQVEEAADQIDPWSIFRGTKGAILLLATGLAWALYWLLLRNGVSSSLGIGVAVTAWALLNWTFDTLPDYVVGLLVLGFVVVVGTVPGTVALSGFANSTWFLSLAVLGLGTAISKSGLMFRTALHMLRTLPANYWGQTLALSITGLMLTPVLPSPSGRLAIASPLVIELSQAMKLKERSKGAAGLGMSVLLGFGQMYFMFLNGTGSCILLWNLLPSEYRAQITWGYWFLAALPLGMVVLSAGVATLLWFFRPEMPVVVRREMVTAQLEALGPMSRLERVTLFVVLTVLAAFVTQPLHGLDPAWVGVAGLLYLVTIGIIDRDGFKRGVDWHFLLLYGTLIGIAAILDQTGVNQAVTGHLVRVFQPLMASPVLFLTAVAALTVAVRVAVPMVAATLMVALALYPVAQMAGIHPFLVTLAIQVASNPWFLAHQNTFFQTTMAGTEGRAFTHKQVQAYALVYAVLTVVAVPLATPWWHWIGLL